jgi:hypothetical protein
MDEPLGVLVIRIAFATHHRNVVAPTSHSPPTTGMWWLPWLPWNPQRRGNSRAKIRQAGVRSILVILGALDADLAAQLGFDERIDVAIHHILDVAAFLAGAEVQHFLIGLEDIGADLVAP